MLYHQYNQVMTNNNLTISDLFIYPIKSLGGIRLESSKVDERGLVYDRRWVLIDEQNRFLTQRELPELVFFSTKIVGQELIVFDKRNPEDILSLEMFPQVGEKVDVQIWDDVCESMVLDDEINLWFSSKLGRHTRLAYMPSKTKRLVDMDYAHEGELTGFSDGYPILIIGEASLADLNKRLELPVGMDRFRPNIVFTGGTPFEEDTMHNIEINGVKMQGVKLCARCVMTTTDQETAMRTKEPLHTLATFRKKNNKIYFGQNLLAKSPGTIYVGDSILYSTNLSS